MNSELIECPACRHSLRVPETLFGDTVRCPECKAYFTAPMRDADGKFGQPILLPAPPVQVRPMSPTPRGDAPFYMPGLLLLLVGTVGLLVNGYVASQWATNPEGAEQSRYELVKRAGKVMGREITDDEARQGIEIAKTVEITFACISVLPVLGAIAMLTLRFRWLAMLGSVVAMFNIGNLCCVIGLPTGGYCLVKLLDPDCKPLFRRRE